MFEQAMFEAVMFEAIMKPDAPVATYEGAVRAPVAATAPTTSSTIPADGADFPTAKFVLNVPKFAVILLAYKLEPKFNPVEALAEIFVVPILMEFPLNHKSRNAIVGVPKS